MAKYTIDRFEKNFAVCEDESGSFINIERVKLPANAKESDIILKNESGYVILENETEKVKKRINDKLQKLFKK